jgi:hypothetical protein
LKLELPQQQGHHDGVAALFAGLRGQWRQVARNEDLGVAVAASDHLQWSSIAHAD